MSLRPESTLFIDTQLVWMTCGVEAGYQLLLAPPTQGTGWAELLEQAFPNFELGNNEPLKSAQVAYEGGRALAVAFFDPTHRDASSRPIKHFMLWLEADEAAFQKIQQLSIPTLLQQLEPAFLVLRQASRYASEQEICRAAQTKQSERYLGLNFSAKKIANKTKTNIKIDTTNPSADDEALSLPQWLLWLIGMIILTATASSIWLFVNSNP